MTDALERALEIAQELVDAGRNDDALRVLSPALDALEARYLTAVFSSSRPLGLRVLSTTETASRRPPVVQQPGERTPAGGRP